MKKIFLYDKNKILKDFKSIYEFENKFKITNGEVYKYIRLSITISKKNRNFKKVKNYLKEIEIK